MRLARLASSPRRIRMLSILLSISARLVLSLAIRKPVGVWASISPPSSVVIFTPRFPARTISESVAVASRPRRSTRVATTSDTLRLSIRSISSSRPGRSEFMPDSTSVITQSTPAPSMREI